MLTAGTILENRYEIEQVLGSGNFSFVYLANDRNFPGGRRVAVKEFNPAAFPPQDQEWARATIQKEAQIRANLPNHAGIAGILDFFRANGREYLVMEYVSGDTLQAIWERQPQRRFREQQVLEWARQLGSVLHFLHQQDPPIIFRDLKPDNIMVRSDGRLTLIDFGIARFYTPGKQRDTINLGTPGYAAPEQYGHAQADARTDIYAFGVVLHQLLTGFDPTQAPINLPAVQALNPQVSARTAAAVQQALAVQPEDRFRAVTAFANALGIELPGSGELARTERIEEAGAATERVDPGWMPAPPEETAPPSASRWPRIAFAAVALLAVGGLAFLLSSRDDDPEPTATPAVVIVTATSDGAVAMATATVPDEAATATVAQGDTEMPTDPPPSATVAPATALPTVTPSPTATTAAGLPLPESRFIVFDSTRDGGLEDIYRMNWDGSGQRRLTSSPLLEEEPDLSPDGLTVAYEVDEGGRWTIHLVSVDGGSSRRLTAGRQPDWSPDGQWIAYEDGYPEDIWIVNVASGERRQVTTGSERERAPSWAPDGDRLAIMAEAGGTWQLFVVDVGSGSRFQITQGSQDKRFPVWSPDGELLAYNTLTSTGGIDHIWTVTPTGNDASRLTSDGANGRPAWSPDGQFILFNSDRNGQWRIYIMARDGSNQRPLTTEGNDQRPDWGALGR